MDSSFFMDTQVGVGECDLLLELDPSILKKKRRTSIRRTIISLLLSATLTLLSQLMHARHILSHTHPHTTTQRPTKGDACVRACDTHDIVHLTVQVCYTGKVFSYNVLKE